MKKVLLALAIWLICVIGALAQQNFFLEISGGPSKSFLSYENSAFEPNFQSFTKLAWHGNFTGFYRLKDEIEIGLQFNLIKRNHWKTFKDGFSDNPGFLGDNIFQSGVVFRKSYMNANQRGFYWQSGLNFIFPSPVFDPFTQEEKVDGYDIGVIRNQFGLGLSGEIGYKVYNLKGNYFTLGVRYQQGLTISDHLNSPIIYDENIMAVHQLKSRGSYASAYLGYGINTENWSKKRKKLPRRYFNENKMIKHNLANDDGFYLLAYGGFRIKEPITPNEDIYFNSSGQFSFMLGYKWRNYSLETGYGQFSAGNSISIDHGDFVWTEWIEYGINTSHVPITIKYDIPISDWKTVRFGPSFGTSVLLSDNTKRKNFISRSNGQVTLDDQTSVDVTGVVRNIPIENRKHFLFNAGIHLEFQVFNSSFMSLNLSRNFDSPVISNIEIDYLIENTQYKYDQEGTLNGFRFDFGWKLPLNILDKNRKLNLKTSI